MDFSYSEEQQVALDSFHRFVASEIRPLVDKYDDEAMPRAEVLEALRRLSEFGVGNGLGPSQYGGLELDALTAGLLFEALAVVSPDLCVPALIQMEAGLLLAAGSEQIKDEYLGPTLRAERIGCIAISEPAVGSNISEIKCRARRDGSDYLLTGEKQWISNGHYSDYCICVAQVMGDEPEGLALFVVDRDWGYESRNIKKMAMNRQSTAQLFFSDVRVPESHLLFPAGEGLRRLMVLLGGSRPFVGLMALGIAQAALDASIAYAQDRSQHGKAIAGHQLIQSRVAEMAVKIEAARLMLYKALDQVSRGERSDLQSGMAKYFATEMACEVTRHALAIHGGNGVTPEYPVEELYRLAPILTVTEGTPEIQKLIIARQLLGVAAF